MLDYWDDKEDTKAQLMMSVERRQDQIADLGRKKRELRGLKSHSHRCQDGLMVFGLPGLWWPLLPVLPCPWQ